MTTRETEAVVFGLPAATATATAIQVGSNSVALRPQFKYVGSIVLADGGQVKEAVLSRAGLQIPQGSSPGGWGWAPSSSSTSPWC